MKNIFIFYIFTLILVCFFSCSKNIHKKIRISTTNSVSSALIYIAKNNNYFKEENLDADVKFCDTGSTALDELFNGNCDVAVSSELSLVLKSLKRNDFKIITSISESENNNKIIIYGDQNFKIPEDIKGKQISTTKENSNYFFLCLYLFKNNLKLNDIKITFAPLKKLMNDFNDKKIDGISAFEPNIIIAKNRTKSKTIILESPGLYHMSLNLTAKNRYILKNKEVIKKMLKSLYKAEVFIQKNPEKSKDIILKNINISKMSLNSIWDDNTFKLSLDQSLLHIMEMEEEWYKSIQKNAGDKDINFANYIYFDGLESIYQDKVTIIH
jgi:ABC-type nitrate/sulfonate/bicarbonate transport system substrate-binding protein